MITGRPTIGGPHHPSRLCHTLRSSSEVLWFAHGGYMGCEYQRCPPLQTLVLRTPQHHNYV